MEINKAIEILQNKWNTSVGDYRFQNPEKLDWEEALYLAIAALERQEKEPCEVCGDTSYLAGHKLDTGTLDVRFDTDNAEIDIILYAKDKLDLSIKINFCPMCGRKLEG